MADEGKFLGIMGLIALRKSELYNEIITQLEKIRNLTDLNKIRIRDMIAKMENNIFLAKKEISDRKIITSLTIKEIYSDISPILKEAKLKLQDD